MIITKDNLLRFVREQKYVTPTIISEKFETSTMIASAALSELSKDKLVAISNLKFGSTPYYYDPRQKECLIELGKKQFSGYDKEALLKIQEQQIINDASLSIQIRLSMDKIKDFAVPLEMTVEGKAMKFWVWYLRDITETKKQINDAISGKSNQTKEVNKTSTIKPQTIKTPRPKAKKKEVPISNPYESSPQEEKRQKGEPFIETFFREHYLNLENKNKTEKSIKYQASLKVRNMTVHFDCIYYLKKPTESDILRYYASSPKPKIIFIENPAKKLIKLSNELENLEVVNV